MEQCHLIMPEVLQRKCGHFALYAENLCRGMHVLHGLLMKMVLGRLIIAEPAGNGIPRLGKNPIY